MKRYVVAMMMSVLAVVAARGAEETDGGGSAARQKDIAEGGNETRGFDMAPETKPEVVAKAVAGIAEKLPAGPFEANWDSIKAHYKVPAWFAEARFGLFMHFGLYAVPAHGNEWYEKHLYGGSALAWHIEHFGDPSVFGYKDFIPKFTCAKFDADAWAMLFKKSGGAVCDSDSAAS